MRLYRSSLLFLSVSALSSCAYEGVVVQKDLEPHPLYLSQGVEGKYTFILQDKAGVRHRQMVTPEVYERYALGQYFNDQETGPSSNNDDSKAMKSDTMTASLSSTSVARVASRTSAKTNGATKTAGIHKSGQPVAHHIAAKGKIRKHSVAAKRKHTHPANRPVTVASITPVAQSPAAAASLDADLRVVTVSRCR